MNILGSVASLIGLVLAAFTLYYAKSAREAAIEAKKAVRKANASEVLSGIGDAATSLQSSIETGRADEGIVRGRDLIAGLSRFKLRYERFLDGASKARLDEARQQVSVISRILATKGVPDGHREKSRVLEICHRDVVSILNEESAKILAAIEKEDENG